MLGSHFAHVQVKRPAVCLVPHWIPVPDAVRTHRDFRPLCLIVHNRFWPRPIQNLFGILLTADHRTGIEPHQVSNWLREIPVLPDPTRRGRHWHCLWPFCRSAYGLQGNGYGMLTDGMSEHRVFAATERAGRGQGNGVFLPIPIGYIGANFRVRAGRKGDAIGVVG
jgi:hypothetical protein